MNFIIDNRERKIIDELKESLISNDIKYELKNLDIGDFEFEINSNKIIIERKTVDDLVASIKDGRYKEQKIRLLQLQKEGMQIIYIIEGDINSKVGKIGPKTFRSVIINGIIRDGIYTYVSSGIEIPVSYLRIILWTVDFLMKTYKMISMNETIFNKNNSSNNNKILNENEYASSIKRAKKDNLTIRVCFINQLSQIPGVSSKMAIAISEQFPNMMELIRNVEIEEGDTICDIRYGNSQRKIGPVVSERIYEYLCRKT